MKNEVLEPNPNRVLTTSSLLKIGDRYYQVRPLYLRDFKVFEFNESKCKTFTMSDGIALDPDVVYLGEDYYYLYRGKIEDIKGFESILPGIYYDTEKCKYVICDPETEEEKAEYRYDDKITSRDADEIRNAVLNHDVVIFNTPDASHSKIPPESLDDDILKRAIKRAIVKKGIDLDQYKTRFVSKNMLFNTKQVLRGPNRLSMLLFDRCAEALNLKYTIILEEAGGEVVGYPMDDEIIISSQDVFDANLNKENKNEES